MNAVNECAAIKSHGRRFQMSNDFRDVDMLLNWVDDRPIVVPKGADRRRSQRARSTDRIFKGLLYLFAVNERHEWSHKLELFDDTRYRATSWSELCALGRRSGADGDYSREQLRRVLKQLTDKGLLDRVKIHNGGKGEEGWKSRLFIRLRFDKLNSTVNWLRGFKASRSLPPSPPAKSRKKTSKKQVVPTEKANQSLFGSSSVTSVIQPALVYTNIEIEHIASGKVSVFAEAGDQVTSDSAIQVNQETSRKVAGFF